MSGRVRGYQFKSEGPNEPKKNATAYKGLEELSPDSVEAMPAGGAG